MAKFLNGHNHQHEIHPSHDVAEDWDVPDPHSPGLRCTVCGEYACGMCPLEYDDDLVKPCLGFSWLDKVTTGLPEKVIARKSGTGWPRTHKKGSVWWE